MTDRYAHIGRPEDGPHQLLQHKADPPSDQKTVQCPSVQPAYDNTLQQNTKQCREQEGYQNRCRKVPVKHSLWKNLFPYILDHISGIGANHYELAVGHVDDAHQPKSDCQSQRRQ